MHTCEGLCQLLTVRPSGCNIDPTIYQQQLCIVQQVKSLYHIASICMQALLHGGS